MSNRPARCPSRTPRRPIDFRDLSPRQGDFLNCLLEGVFAALPYFLDSFLGCLGGSSSEEPDQYTPGDRNRC